MRIIDKKTDFYDYLQEIYPDNSLIFDRVNSYILTKEDICNHLPTRKNLNKKEKNYDFLLLQVCNTFWLFLVEIIQINEYNYPVDFAIDLITEWKNYNKERVLIKLDVITFWWSLYSQLEKNFTKEGITEKSEIIIKSIDTKDFRKLNTIINIDNIKEKKIPLLKASGLAKHIEPLDIFLALEEYFSLEKTANERREPYGITDLDRIERHGFDLKTSFRGKNK